MQFFLEGGGGRGGVLLLVCLVFSLLVCLFVKIYGRKAKSERTVHSFLTQGENSSMISHWLCFLWELRGGVSRI